MVAPIRRLALATSVVLALMTGQAHAQFSMLLDPSIRSAAMGGACNAVTWGDITNDWANPALLGCRSGVRYEWGTTQLLPDFSFDAHFITNRMVLGYGGIGFISAGEPVNLGGSKVHFAPFDITDDQGNVFTVPESYEEVRTWGVGVSLSRSVGALIGHGALPSVLRMFDVAAGYNQKKIETNVGGSVYQMTTGRDVGVLVQFSPSMVPLNVSYGYAITNADDATYTILLGSAIPNPRIYRSGIAVRTVGTIPGLPKSMLGGLLGASVSLGAAFDWEKHQSGDDTAGASHVQRMGFELEALRAISIRVGRVEDGVVGTTYGFGVGLDWQGLVGARYDFAIYPEAPGYRDLHRQGVSAYVDPVAVVRRAH
jgi:hypothetical protein